jgi:hypothetical protein
MSLFASDIKILMLTDFYPNNVTQNRAVDDVIEALGEKYGLTSDNFKHLNLTIKNQSEFKNNSILLQRYLKANKEDVVYIWSVEDTNQVLLNLKLLQDGLGDILSDIPIVCGVGAKESLSAIANEKYNAKIFTTSSLSDTKAEALYNLVRAEHYTHVINVGNKQNCDATVLSEVEYINEQFLHLKGLLSQDIDNIVFDSLYFHSDCQTDNIKPHEINTLLSNPDNKVLFIFGEYTTKETRALFDNFSWRIRILRYLNGYNNLGAYLLNIADSEKNRFKEQYPIYFDEYDLKNSQVLTQYEETYNKFLTQIDLVLDSIKGDLHQDPVVKVPHFRKYIVDRLQHTTRKSPYFNTQTNSIIMFKEKDGYFYNNIYEDNLYLMYLTRLDGMRQRLDNRQTFLTGNNPNIPVMYADIDVKNLVVKDLNASSVYVELLIRTVSSSDLSLIDIIDLNSIKDSTYLSKSEILTNDIVKDKHGNKFYKKTYRIQDSFPVSSNLLNFPFDKQDVKIKMVSKYDKITGIKPIIQVFPINKSQKFTDWKINKIGLVNTKEFVVFPESSITNDVSLEIHPINELTITIERTGRYLLVLKYTAPMLMFIFLMIYTMFKLYYKITQDGETSVFTNTMVGIMNVYFIFSLLININKIIWFDIFFFAMLGISMVMMIVNINRYQSNFDKHYSVW